MEVHLLQIHKEQQKQPRSLHYRGFTHEQICYAIESSKD
jgi:SOS response regulatory protein OraA/RecX